MEHIVKINIPNHIPYDLLDKIDEPDYQLLEIKIKIITQHNTNNIIKQKIFDLLPHNSTLTNPELMSLPNNKIKKNTIDKLIKDINNNLSDHTACVTKYINSADDPLIKKTINTELGEIEKKTVSCYNTNKFYILYSIAGLIFLTGGYYDTILEVIKEGPINYYDILFPIIKNNELELNNELVNNINEGTLDKNIIDRILIHLNKIIQEYSMTITTIISKNKFDNINCIDDVKKIINIKYLDQLIANTTTNEAYDGLSVGEELKYGVFRFGKYYFLSFGFETVP